MLGHTGIPVRMSSALFVLHHKDLEFWCVKEPGSSQLCESYLSEKFPHLIAVTHSFKNSLEGACLRRWSAQSKWAEFVSLWSIMLPNSAFFVCWLILRDLNENNKRIERLSINWDSHTSLMFSIVDW
jgi:hypothetical protein